MQRVHQKKQLHFYVSVWMCVTSQPGHTKDHHKNGTNCLLSWHAMRLGWSLTVQPDCLKLVKGRVVCGTVYGDMHLKDLLGSVVRVGYRIPVPDFYLVLHGLRCWESNPGPLRGNPLHYRCVTPAPFVLRRPLTSQYWSNPS